MTTTATPDPTPACDLWSAEFGDTLTGFEEKFIVDAFGRSIDALGAEGGLYGIRALVFAHRVRNGDKTRAAKQYALDLTRAEVAGYFAGIGSPPDGESPDTEGKD